MNLSNGTLLNDRYEIIERLGSGGMAIAYCASDKVLDRFVTIKVLREEFSADDEFKKKFKIEARSAASLSDPNIVSVYDVGEYNGISYIVMEYIHGDTLKKAIKEKAPFDTKTIINISLQIASAISAAHRNKVVHRDIKPQNILINSDGIIKVTDFGIAKAATGSTIETTANAVGSVYYFSPEQARGGYVDEKSDIYSLGITMFEMATGKLPFDGENTVSIALKHLSEELPDMRVFNPNLSKNLELIIKKATMKRSSDRYQSINDMINDLMIVIENDESNKLIFQNNNISESDNIDFISSRKKISDDMNNKNESSSKSLIKILNEDDEFEPEYFENEMDKRDDSLKRNSNLRNKKDKKYYESEYDKSQEKKVIFAAVLTAFFIIGLISYVGIKFLRISTTKSVIVPNFLGINIEKAKISADEIGIKLLEIDSDYSNYDEGIIFEQNYNEGASIKKGSEVSVKVSKGFLKYDMPDLKGKEEKEAVKILNDELGIDPDISYEFDEKIETGFIINQFPESGEKITVNSEIQLIVSKGEEFKKVSVPNIVGQTQNNAKKSLESKGLILGTITKTESEKVEAGKVITQTIKAGTEVAKNSVVDIVVSTGSTKKEEQKESVKEEQKEPVKEEQKEPPKKEEQKEPVKEEQKEPPKKDEVENNENNTVSTDLENNQNNNNNQNEVVNNKTSTRNFPLYLKNDEQYSDVVHVKVVKNNEDGTVSVIKDSSQPVTSFPSEISITGSGKSTIDCYINGKLLWSESVNFSEN